MTVILEYKKYFLEYKDGIEKYQCLKDFVEDIFHDLRKFNAQLMGKSQVLYNKSKGSQKGMKFLDLSQNISAICAFMRLRLDAYDFMYNEIPMNATEKTNYNIYRIFDRGFRGENARRHTSEGSGIGLYTAYKICELHNATIQAFYEKNEFIIDVKINKEYNI